MKFLQSMSKHRAVFFQQQISADFHDIIGAYAQKVLVIGGVVDFAQRDAVCNGSNALFMRIRDDMRCIEQLHVVKCADSAVLVIGPHYHGPKHWLMETLSGHALSVPLLDLVQRRAVIEDGRVLEHSLSIIN